MPNSMPIFPAFDERKRTMPKWKLRGSDLVFDDDGDEQEPVSPATTGETVPDDDGFNPAVHTIDEVKAYVEANPDDAEAVFAAESDGKNRSTLVTWLTDFIDGSVDDGD